MEEAELRRVADELAIRGLVARYSDSASRLDTDDWIQTWAEEGRWILGGNPSEGRAKILETFQAATALFDRVLQLPQAGVVELDEGGPATGRWSVVELLHGKDGGASLTVGFYHDVYQRTQAGWRFAERRFEVAYAGPPDLSGVWPG